MMIVTIITNRFSFMVCMILIVQHHLTRNLLIHSMFVLLNYLIGMKHLNSIQYFDMSDTCYIFRFITYAFDDGVDMRDPRISVFLNPSPDRLPATLFIVAELDALRDDSFGIEMFMTNN